MEAFVCFVAGWTIMDLVKHCWRFHRWKGPVINVIRARTYYAVEAVFCAVIIGWALAVIP